MEILEINETHLAKLGQRIADHGADSAGAELATLADVASCYGVAPGASAALVDPASSGVVRERAFAVTALAVLRAARDAAWDDTDVTEVASNGTTDPGGAATVASTVASIPVESVPA